MKMDDQRYYSFFPLSTAGGLRCFRWHAVPLLFHAPPAFTAVVRCQPEAIHRGELSSGKILRHRKSGRDKQFAGHRCMDSRNEIIIHMSFENVAQCSFC